MVNRPPDALAQGFKNLLGSPQSWGIAWGLLHQLASDVGDGLAQQFMQWINFGWMSEVFVADGSESVMAGGGNDVLFGGAGLGGAGNDTFIGGGANDSFVFVVPTSGLATETVNDSTGNGQVAVLETNGDVSFLGGTAAQPLATVADQTDTWTDGQGTLYKFDAVSGDLDIMGGSLGSGNEIVLDNFNLGSATRTVAQGGAANGYLGFHLADAIQLTAGATAGVDPPAPDFTAGTTQAYTVSVDAPGAAAQAVTVTLSGAPASDFGLLFGTSIIPLNADGTLTVTIPAGQTSVSFSLVNTGDVGSDVNLQVVASITGPTNQNDTLSSMSLTQSYVEPPQDPFQKPTVSQLYYSGTNALGDGNYSDKQNSSSDSPVGSIANSNEFITLDGPGGESISGGIGSDTIYGGPGGPGGQGGVVGPVSVINGDGGHDIIDIIGPAPVEVYANSAEDLAQAVADSESGTPTDQQGDLISSANDNATLVGGNGNDLLLSGSSGVIVAGPGNDTIAGGGYVSGTDGLENDSWSAKVSENQLSIDGNGLSFQTAAGSNSYGANYEGNVDSSGYALGTGSNTIFGGAGSDVILLSNGSDEVNLGTGNSTVLGGMGGDSIFGGSGNDCILGGGGSDYIAVGGGNDFIVGRGGNNTIFGGSGTDTIFAGGSDPSWATEESGSNYVQGGSGDSLIYGSGGNDTLIGGSGSDTIQAGNGNESIVASSGDTSINGGGGADTIVAGSGSDTIWGSTQSTTIYGGTGTDWIEGSGGSDVIYAGDGGTAQAATSVIAGSGNTTIYGGDGIDQIFGGSGSNVIYAGDGGTATAATEIAAGSGATTIYGGNGVDAIYGGSGTDILYSGDGGEEGSATYVIGGSGKATLFGGAGTSVLNDSASGNDVLQAGSGNATLVGEGADTLIAGSGSDYFDGGPNTTYVFASDVGSDEVANGDTASIEFASSVSSSDLSVSAALDGVGEGVLTIDDGDGWITLDGALSNASAAWAQLDGSQRMRLSQFIEQEASVGGASTQILAADQGNLIFDPSEGALVSGGSGQDSISAWGDNDTLSAGSGGTQIFAQGNDDFVTGGQGNDTLVAAGLGTTLVGGTGNEVFEVNDPSEVVQAQHSASSNELYSSVSYTLPANVDFLTLTGTDDLAATGNTDASNIITGNSGNDTLTAGSGSDALVSGSGVDTLVGGSGADTFIVNNSADEIDVPDNNGWRDTIQSSVDYVLSAPISNLQLTGSADLSASDDYGYAKITGNAGKDTLTAGSGNDTLVAGMGIDTLVAGSGSTMFVLNNTADVVQAPGQTGNDTIESSVSYSLVPGVDYLELTGSADLEGYGNSDASDRIVGNSGDDTLVAGSGADTLVAGTGSDTLVAGAGADLLQGGLQATTYLLDSGFGQVNIEPGGGPDTLQFGSGIMPSNLTVGAGVDPFGNPALLIQDGSGSVTIGGALTGSIGSFDFADGTELSLAGLLTSATAVPGSVAGPSGDAILDTSTAASLSGSGNDTILGVGASDTIVGGFGDEYLLAAGANASTAGGFGSDTLVGAGANDTVVAGTGNQQLYALGTDDLLTGGIGSDTLHGSSGDDTLVAGSGSTVIYGGDAADSIVLIQGAAVTLYPSGSSGVEIVHLPSGMSLSEFTSYQGADGELVLQSVGGDTTATIKGYDGASGKLWLITDDSGDIQPLASWVDSQHQPPSSYRQEIDQLRQEFAAGMTDTLNQIGQQGGSIQEPSNLRSDSSTYQYQFDGVTARDITVQGGTVVLGDSESDQRTSTTLQSGSTSFATTTPVYGDVTIPGSRSFISQNSPAGEALQNGEIFWSGPGAQSALSVNAGADGAGNPGWWVTAGATTAYEQTGARTTVETVPEYTTYTQETESITAYNVTGDGGNDVITVGPEILDPYGRDVGPYFVGTVNTGNGNVSVDLGMNNGLDPGRPDPTYYFPDQLPPGAFIEAGDGIDTIKGTGGADVIAAGIGFDTITAAFGSTVYVPLQGASTEDIHISGPFYGSGPIPPSTLVLPQGITPQDLHFALITNVPNPNSAPYPINSLAASGQALQLTYGDSTVLMDFGFNTTLSFPNRSGGDTDGIDRLQFSDGTVLTRDQILAMTGPEFSESEFLPTVTALSPVVTVDSTIAGTSLFEVSDTSGSDITWYQISNSGTGGAHFLLNGVVQTPGQIFYVSKEGLSGLTYDAGAAGSSDSIKISAFDGVVWGPPTSFNIAPTGSVYEATGPNQSIAGASSGPDTIVGSFGGDTLVGSSAQDTFEYNAGGGAEVISETTVPSSANADVLQFGKGIAPASLSLGITGNSQLLLSFANSAADSVSISGFDPLDPLQSFPIQTFAFSDGTKMSLLQLLGSSGVAGSSGSITNADGSTTTYEFTTSSQQIYYAQNVNAAGQLSASVSLDADGSEVTNSFVYAANGGHSDTIVSTPGGGGASTTTTYGYDASGHFVSEQVRNPDGSTGSYTYNAQGQELTGNLTNADGSTSDSTFTYNTDGTYSDTIISAPAGGGASTTTIYGYDASGHFVSEQVKNPDGSAGSYTYNAQGQELTGNVTNADGSTNDSTLTYNADGTYSDTIVSTPAGGGASTTTTYGYDASGHLLSEQVKNPDGSTGSYTYNAQGQELTGNVTNADGSTSDSTLTYNADGTHSDTIVSTPAEGGGSTTTTYGYDASGHLLSEQVKNPDGSTGSYTYNAQGQELSGDVTSANGSTVDSTFAYNSDGSYSDTVVTTAAGGGAATTTVYDYNAQGGLVNDNTYVPGSGGSYTDSWSRADGSHCAYWWNASTSEYQESWYNSDGSYWTDDYKYAAGGSPGVTGYSFLETYDGSDGSQGTRQYDASTGTVTLSWNSAATGQLNGTTADSGFLGLQNQGELTNNQQDLTFFNPSVSPGFSAFLAAH